MKFLIKLTIKIFFLLIGIVFLIKIVQRCSFCEALEIADEALKSCCNYCQCMKEENA